MLTEAHLTLNHDAASDHTIRSWVAARGLRLTCIQLSHGAYPQHIMVTSHVDTTADEAFQRAAALRAELEGLGAKVTRLKLEVPFDALVLESRYLEHHVKVRLPRARMALLYAIAGRHGAHASRNPYKAQGDFEERFLTERFPPKDHDRATRSLESLLAGLGAHELTVLRVERERVLYDDHLELDLGWATELS
jgi:hypothetical protein